MYNERRPHSSSKPDQVLVIDGIPFHTVDTADIPLLSPRSL